MAFKQLRGCLMVNACRGKHLDCPLKTYAGLNQSIYHLESVRGKQS